MSTATQPPSLPPTKPICPNDSTGALKISKAHLSVAVDPFSSHPQQQRLLHNGKPFLFKALLRAAHEMFEVNNGDPLATTEVSPWQGIFLDFSIENFYNGQFQMFPTVITSNHLVIGWLKLSIPDQNRRHWRGTLQVLLLREAPCWA